MMMETSISLHIHLPSTLDQMIWINIPRLILVMISQIGYGSIMVTTEPKDKLLPMLDSLIEKLLNTKHQPLISFLNTLDLNLPTLKVVRTDITEI